MRCTYYVSVILALTIRAQGQVEQGARIGDDVTLTCTGVTYDGLGQSWSKDSTTLVAIQTPLGGTTPSPPFYYDSDIATAGLANRFTASGDLTTVTITDVTEGDDGAYQCASGSSSYTVQLISYKLLSVAVQPESPVTGYVGDAADITCTADSKPAASFNWTKQGDSSFMTTGATLRLNDLKTNNTGTYVCTAYHQYASDTVSVQLNVSPASLKPGLSTGAIVGIVIGSLAGVALIVIPIVIVLTKPKICYS
ncbi:cell adhesion molecule CEACAM6-like [Branchiostoma floridae x Branchiostoma belcheri]